MFYSMRIALLASLAVFSGMQAIPDTIKEQVFSFSTGLGAVILGMEVGFGVSYITGRSFEQKCIAVALGALGGAAFDHYYWGGKEDKNQVARKLGNAFPLVVTGCGVLYYNNKRIVVNQTNLPERSLAQPAAPKSGGGLFELTDAALNQDAGTHLDIPL